MTRTVRKLFGLVFSFLVVFTILSPLVKAVDLNAANLEVTLIPDDPDASLRLERTTDGGVDGFDPVMEYNDPEREDGKYIFRDIDLGSWCDAGFGGVLPQEFAFFTLYVESNGQEYTFDEIDLSNNCGGTERKEINLDQVQEETVELTFKLSFRDPEDDFRLKPMPPDLSGDNASRARVNLNGENNGIPPSPTVEGNARLFRTRVEPGEYEFEIVYNSPIPCRGRGNVVFIETGTARVGDRGLTVVRTVPPSDESIIMCEGVIDFDPVEEDPPIPSCSEQFPAVIGWAICAVLDLTDRAIETLLSTLNKLLSVNPSEVNTQDMRQAWSFFRNIASLLLVVIGLIMIIGQAISKE